MSMDGNSLAESVWRDGDVSGMWSEQCLATYTLKAWEGRSEVSEISRNEHGWQLTC
jgi:hypothetical protein